MLLGKRQEPAAVIKAGQFVCQREGLNRCLRAFAFGDVLDLKDEVKWLSLGVANQRGVGRTPKHHGRVYECNVFPIGR